MKIDLHDSIFSPNGASFLDKDASKILLKKRHTGAVYTPKEGERSPGRHLHNPSESQVGRYLRRTRLQ